VTTLSSKQHSVPFIVSPSTAAFSHIKPTSTRTYHDSSRVQGHDERTLYSLKARCHYTRHADMLVPRSHDTRSKQPADGNLPAVVAVESPVCPCTGTGWGPSELPKPASMICHLPAEMERWVKLTARDHYKHYKQLPKLLVTTLGSSLYYTILIKYDVQILSCIKNSSDLDNRGWGF